MLPPLSSFTKNLKNSQQPVHLSSKTFAQAAQIAEKIESLEKQLSVILQGGNSIAEKQGTPKVPLRPAVVAILKKSKKPLKTAEIYDTLVAQGYNFTFKEPKKVLGIRLYKMLGVHSLGGGLFKAK